MIWILIQTLLPLVLIAGIVAWTWPRKAKPAAEPNVESTSPSATPKAEHAAKPRTAKPLD